MTFCKNTAGNGASGSRNSYLDVGMIVFCNVVLTLQYSREMKVQYEN